MCLFSIIISILCHSEPQDQVREAEVLSLSHAISLISSTLSSKTHTIRRLKVIGSERESEKKKWISLINLSACESNLESSRRPVYKPVRVLSLTHTQHHHLRIYGLVSEQRKSENTLKEGT